MNSLNINAGAFDALYVCMKAYKQFLIMNYANAVIGESDDLAEAQILARRVNGYIIVRG